jgi:hypothetical protein
MCIKQEVAGGKRDGRVLLLLLKEEEEEEVADGRVCTMGQGSVASVADAGCLRLAAAGLRA